MTKTRAGRAMGYVRVSTDRQVEQGCSLEAQEERLRAYCQMAGLALAEIVREEGVSASVSFARRPAGQYLIRSMKEQQVTHVVALKLDRLFRNVEDCLQQTRLWDKAGIALHLIDMGGMALNTASAMGRMFLTMTAAFAELERNLTSERTVAALAHKRSKGERTGSVRFGFQLAQDGVRLEPAVDEQGIIARVLELRSEGFTTREIAGALNEAKVTTRRGGAWRHEYVVRVLKSAETAPIAA